MPTRLSNGEQLQHFLAFNLITNTTNLIGVHPLPINVHFKHQKHN